VETATTGEPAAPGAELAPGTVVGEYRIEAVAGRGGFGTVYRAVHPLIGKQVAIKVLAPKLATDPAMLSRFVAEARAVNVIRHPNIIDIVSFGELPDGRSYYVMEYLDGDTLDAYLREHGAMALAEASPILRAVARALDAAHAKGIAHRDLKPENIFLARDADGTVFPKLLDFGIAKLLAPDEDVRHRTSTGAVMGTPYYMSPEQCHGRGIDHRTDIYSMGVVAFRTLTAAYPFDGTYVELMAKHVLEEPPLASTKNPALPPAVDRGIAWMMQKDPAKRPASVLAGIKALLDEPQVSQGALPAVRRRRRARWLAIPAVLAVAAVVVVVAMSRHQPASTLRAPDAAAARAPDAAAPAVVPVIVDAAAAAVVPPVDATAIAVDAGVRRVDTAPRPDAAPSHPHPHQPAHDDLERPKF